MARPSACSTRQMQIRIDAADIRVGGGRPRRSSLRLQLGLGDQTFITDRGFGSMGLLVQQAV